MHRIIVSDIFGKTKALETISESLSGTVEIFDPYNSALMNFESESQAYSYFTNEVGLDKYTEILEAYVTKLNKPVSLLGFSVGASAIWKISEKREYRHISGALCFYGSQIRNYQDIIPHFPIQLVFPSFENHFSVSDLVLRLSQIDRVEIHQSGFLHGFMNSDSQNFNQKAYARYLQALCNVPFNKCIQTTVFAGT